jgi:hypothetical protein
MLKSVWFWIFVTLIGIQFIPMNVPLNLPSDEKSEIEAPKEILKILQRACYACHSNNVELPWYDTIAPASWYVKKHISDGRQVVNFSQWNKYDKNKQLKILKKLPKSIIIRMPLPSYLWLHQEAKLSHQEKKILKKWVEETKDSIK